LGKLKNNMFLESNNNSGYIEVVCGSMFSGKTEELIRRINRVKIAEQPYKVFKPMIDDRYSATKVVSHAKNEVNSKVVLHSSEIIKLSEWFDVIGVDEVQFFDEGIVDVCTQLANSGKRVIVAGLDMDYTGKPFGPMAGLLSVAEFVTKVKAICMDCSALSNFSYRLGESEEVVMLGEKKEYIPLCRKCFNKRNDEG
jgi:thymidine kinase